MRRDLRDGLESILSANVEAVLGWLDNAVKTAEVMATREAVQSISAGLAKTDAEDLAASPLQAEMAAALRDAVETNGYLGHAIIDGSGRFLASPRPESIGTRSPVIQPYLATERQTIVMPPRKVGEDLFIVVLTRLGDDGCWLAFVLDPTRFTDQLEKGRVGESAETYAFDPEGTMISYCRFGDDLRALGILDEGERSILNVEVRNPGGNMVEGFEPTTPLKARPLTKMAASALALREEGRSAVESDVDGYPDYRGVPVVGAWTWIDEYEIGIATEQDVSEAYSYVDILRRRLWILFGLLGLAAIGAGIYNYSLQTMRTKVNEAQRLGQYTLGERIGKGGMGEVYHATHAMLKRPTAIKLLPRELADSERQVRFEREVQHTAELSHHNTVAIYDYGTSPDGAFYYAMEYVDGVTLELLVNEAGPLPAARAIFLLKQACGSLAEAHALGIVHRDIKPANLMIGNRPGMPDHLKVLDFGLVKLLDAGDAIDVTIAGDVLGTPRYLSPEAIRNAENVDARSDIYALGAVGYFLVTGTHLFEGATLAEIINHHISTEPERPTDRLGKPVPEELEEVLLWCLAKDPDQRPISAEALYDKLDALANVGTWSREEAAAWWQEFRVFTQKTSAEDSEHPTLLR